MRTRETVAWVINKCSTASVTHHQFADEILSALHAAGYRLIGPRGVDDVAAAMWREEAIDSGTPSSVAQGRTREAFDEQADGLKDKWRKLAAASLRSLNGGSDHG